MALLLGVSVCGGLPGAWTSEAAGLRPHFLLPACAGANRALGLSDKLFALGDSVIINALYRIALMPVFVLSARICPEVRPQRSEHRHALARQTAPHCTDTHDAVPGHACEACPIAAPNQNPWQLPRSAPQ